MEVRSDKSSLRDVIRNLPRTKLGEINEREIAPLTDELRNKNAMLQAKYNALETENNILMRTTIQQECDLLLVSRFKAKQMKAVKRLKLLQFIRERVLNAMNNSEMLWILMKIDLEKLSEHMKNAQKYVAGDYTLKKAYVRYDELFSVLVLNLINRFLFAARSSNSQEVGRKEAKQAV